MRRGKLSFISLVGTNTTETEHLQLFTELLKIAAKEGWQQPDFPMPVSSDGPIESWSSEQMGPYDEEDAQFVLAVTAPDCPGISPIWPFFLSFRNPKPLFAVVVIEKRYVVFREDKRDVAEFNQFYAVRDQFHSFLSWVAGGIAR